MRDLRRDLPSEFVHLTQRGVGRRIIFEDDADCRYFLETLRLKAHDERVPIIAWCLMPNHFHILVEAPHERITKMMLRLQVSYAQHYNGRHGHTGRVFQNRFHAEPVTNEAHLLAAIRYIHRNCCELGIAELAEYRWSSFRELAGAGGAEEETPLCDRRTVLGFFGGPDAFASFHADASEVDAFCRIDGYRPRMDDHDARSIAERRFGEEFADRIAAMGKPERDASIALLKDLGLSIRQIERLTGIGRGIIARAKR